MQGGDGRALDVGRDMTSGSSSVRTGGEDIYLRGATIADQDFIARARQDVPMLIEEVRALRGAVLDMKVGVH